VNATDQPLGPQRLRETLEVWSVLLALAALLENYLEGLALTYWGHPWVCPIPISRIYLMVLAAYAPARHLEKMRNPGAAARYGNLFVDAWVGMGAFFWGLTLIGYWPDVILPPHFLETLGGVVAIYGGSKVAGHLLLAKGGAQDDPLDPQTGAGASLNDEDRKLKILDYVAKAEDRRITRQRCEQLLELSGTKVYRLLEELVNEGRLKKAGKPGSHSAYYILP
jgi:hypothetical protein